MSELRCVARAIDALRRGWPVAIGDGERRLVLLAVETADQHRLDAFDPAAQAELLLSHQRAATLDLTSPCEADKVPMLLQHGGRPTLEVATALADPAHDLTRPIKGPLTARPCAGDEAFAAIRLARFAGLLPAFYVRNGGEAEADLQASQIAAYEEPARLRIAARARLPIAAAHEAEIIAFRSLDEANEHIALVIGMPDGGPPLVRLHSECLTGDVLGSLKCDCGAQLRTALAELAGSGWGILLYLRQEGRGIGLVNKLRAYALQDDGFDTIDANTRLGFATDERDFSIAARMLNLLGLDRVRLLTNNPAKVDGLAGAGIIIVERVPHTPPSNTHNAAYLDTKRRRAGHLL